MASVSLPIYNKTIKKKRKYNYINVAYSVDGYFHYITHISMKSIMLSQNNSTFIIFYILCSNINKEQKEVINRIKTQHNNCEIEYIDMGNTFKDLRIPKAYLVHWTTANFYRIELQNIFPYEKKILFLDGDTLIYKDLNDLYNYNIDGKFYVGMLENGDFNAIYYKKKFDNYINTGVILCNLEELRKGNISEKYLNFYKSYIDIIRYPVNEILNIVSHEKNGYFPPNYVVIGFCDEEDALNYYSKSPIKVNKNEVLKAYKDPYIYHLIYYGKPWKNIPKKGDKICVDRFIRFYEMARKTDFYYVILEKFKIE